MSFAFVPAYIGFLGIEAYGLIGFFTSMMAAFAVLDLGLGITVNRELSCAAGKGEGAGQARDLFRTLELIYWVIALVIGLSIALLAPLIVDHWLNIRSLDRDTVVNGVRAMGVTALMRWPVSLYFGALLGMQQQVRLNIVTSAAATLAGAGAVGVLGFVADDIAAFFLWQAAIASLQVLVLRWLAWRAAPMPEHRPKIGFGVLRASIGFSSGVTGIMLLSVILTQLDKFALSWLLPLDIFGYYALAAAIAAMLLAAGAAVESAAFPALSRLVATGDVDGERQLYHQASRWLAILIIPLTITVVLFAPELLIAYLRDPAIAAATAPFLSLLAAGNGILALMFMPLALQLAHGWTRLSLIKNIIAVCVFVPLLFLFVQRLGALGAGWTWISLTLGYVLIEVPVMHRRLLPGAQWAWYLKDNGIPLIISLGVLGLLRMLLSPDIGVLPQLALIGGATFMAQAGSVALLASARKMVLRHGARLRPL